VGPRGCRGPLSMAGERGAGAGAGLASRCGLGWCGGRRPAKEKSFSFSTVLQLHRVKNKSGKNT
jgi:hypothetical protein